MNPRSFTASTVAAALFTAAAALAGTSAAPPPTAPADGMPANCPMHAQHMAEKAAKESAAHAHPGAGDHAAMNARGDEGMGFSQTATTHHFLITPAGGEIRVEANDPADAKSRDQIRGHLVEIARSFAAGDFAIPMFVHDQTPPGVPAMIQLGGAVDYLYSDLAQGGRVEIKTSNAEALAAIHQFLRFQIEEHRTGDPIDPKPTS